MQILDDPMNFKARTEMQGKWGKKPTESVLVQLTGAVTGLVLTANILRLFHYWWFAASPFWDAIPVQKFGNAGSEMAWAFFVVVSMLPLVIVAIVIMFVWVPVFTFVTDLAEARKSIEKANTVDADAGSSTQGPDGYAAQVTPDKESKRSTVLNANPDSLGNASQQQQYLPPLQYWVMPVLTLWVIVMYFYWPDATFQSPQTVFSAVFGVFLWYPPMWCFCMSIWMYFMRMACDHNEHFGARLSQDLAYGGLTHYFIQATGVIFASVLSSEALYFWIDLIRGDWWNEMPVFET